MQRQTDAPARVEPSSSSIQSADVNTQGDATGDDSSSRKAAWLPQIAVALIEAAPKLLTIFAVIGLAIVFRDEIRRLVPRLSGVEAFGVKLSLQDIEEWRKRSNEDRNLGVTSDELKAAMRRGEKSQDAYKTTRLLWVDDHPENNIWERRALQSLSATIDIAISNGEAWDKIRRNEYDLVISDLRRDDGEDPRQLANKLRTYVYQPQLIYYTGDLPNPLPQEAFATTIYPDN